MVEVHDAGGLGERGGGEVPDPGGAVADDGELAEVVRAAADARGPDQARERGGGREGGGEAGGGGGGGGLGRSGPAAGANSGPGLPPGRGPGGQGRARGGGSDPRPAAG